MPRIGPRIVDSSDSESEYSEVESDENDDVVIVAEATAVAPVTKAKPPPQRSWVYKYSEKKGRKEFFFLLQG